MASLAISHSAGSQRHVVGTELLGLPFRQGRALIKNSVFCWMPLNVCQHFYFILCHSSYRRLHDIFLSRTCAFPRPSGGDGSSGGGQGRGPEPPLTSSHRCQRGPARWWNHPLLFESNWTADLNCTILLFIYFFNCNASRVPFINYYYLLIFSAGGQNPRRYRQSAMRTEHRWVEVCHLPSHLLAWNCNMKPFPVFIVSHCSA